MQVQIGSCTLELVTGDITQQATDAIVNAANSRLAGGGGPSIMAETRQNYPQGCPTGGAVITGAGNLPARYVIHAVGPIWGGGQQDEASLLASAYRRSLEVAVAHDCHSVAFPSLSTGAYGYPVDQAAQTALHTVLAFLREHTQPELVRFVLFDARARKTFAAVLNTIQTNQN